MRRWPRADRRERQRAALRGEARVSALGSGTAIGADVAARPWFASDSCAAAGSDRAAAGHRGEHMTIPPELEAQILRYYPVEKWRVGTIARQLHVHHATVVRVLAQAGLPRTTAPARRCLIDPYLPFLRETLEKFPTLTASRLYAMVRERGYRGGPEHFRHVVACHRPRRPAEAYLRLRSLPGEQAQVDWGHFGHLRLSIGRAGRPRPRICPKPLQPS
jgi:hypothetical protein